MCCEKRNLNRCDNTHAINNYILSSAACAIRADHARRARSNEAWKRAAHRWPHRFACRPARSEARNEEPDAPPDDSCNSLLQALPPRTTMTTTRKTGRLSPAGARRRRRHSRWPLSSAHRRPRRQKPSSSVARRAPVTILGAILDQISAQE
jgi:hypothetical protein